MVLLPHPFSLLITISLKVSSLSLHVQQKPKWQSWVLNYEVAQKKFLTCFQWKRWRKENELPPQTQIMRAEEVLRWWRAQVRIELWNWESLAYPKRVKALFFNYILRISFSLVSDTCPACVPTCLCSTRVRHRYVRKNNVSVLHSCAVPTVCFSVQYVTSN